MAAPHVILFGGGASMKLTFDQWKQEVDAWISRIMGLTSDDLPDWDYWKAWDSGMSARAAAFHVYVEPSQLVRR